MTRFGKTGSAANRQLTGLAHLLQPNGPVLQPVTSRAGPAVRALRVRALRVRALRPGPCGCGPWAGPAARPGSHGDGDRDYGAHRRKYRDRPPAAGRGAPGPPPHRGEAHHLAKWTTAYFFFLPLSVWAGAGARPAVADATVAGFGAGVDAIVVGAATAGATDVVEGTLI